MTAAQDFFYYRIKWISFYRVVVAFISLLMVIYWKSKIEIIEQSAVFLKILIFIFIISLIYVYFIKKKLFLKIVAIFQVAVDIVIVSLIVAYTGGIDSPLIFFYAFIIMEGGRFFGKNGAYILMALSIFFLGLLFLAQYFKFFPFNNIVMQRLYFFRDEFYYTYSVFSLGFLLLGLLIGYLSQETTRMQKEIVDREAKYYDLESLKSAILNSLNSGLIVFSKDGSVTFMNEIAKKILSLFDSDIDEKKLKSYFIEEINDVNMNERIIRGEKQISLKNGSARWIGYSIVPIYDHNGFSIGALFNFQDITSFKDMEERIRINDKFAFMGKLSAFLAHEIRNPLASLKGGIEFLMESVKVDEDTKKVSEIIQREIERLNKIITDFLYYTRISKPVRTNIYIKNLIDEIWFELKFIDKGENGFNLIYEGNENLILKGDANQMRQVFMNLFINAIDAMKKNGGKNIYVKTYEDENEVIISVEDEGGGIDKENLNRIFEPFFSTKESGTGIGLSIVYKIIQEHGGEITVQNSIKGAKFNIRFALNE